jgi:dUTP pyrophosphatase
MFYDIKVKYHIEGMEKIEKIEKGDWIDLRSSTEYKLKQGEFALIDLGVSIKLPSGYEAHLVPRSSTFKKYGILQVNSIGIIDESYCGENDRWMMPIYAVKDTIIEKNDRICQFRVMPKMEAVRIIEVKKMEDASRGGFGSTGVK